MMSYDVVLRAGIRYSVESLIIHNSRLITLGLTAFEIRLALLYKSRHAFFLVVGGEGELEVFALEVQAFVQMRFKSPVYGFFGQAGGYRAHGRNAGRESVSFLQVL